MYVRGFGQRSTLKQKINELDDRAGAVGKGFGHLDNTGGFNPLFGQRKHLLFFMLVLKVVFNDVLKLLPHRHNRDYLFAGQVLHLTDRRGVLRIIDKELQFVPVQLPGQHAKCLTGIFGNECNDLIGKSAVSVDNRNEFNAKCIGNHTVNSVDILDFKVGDRHRAADFILHDVLSDHGVLLFGDLSLSQQDIFQSVDRKLHGNLTFRHSQP